jgi:hypothetical protein
LGIKKFENQEFDAVLKSANLQNAPPPKKKKSN